jgi:hypothetical protein
METRHSNRNTVIGGILLIGLGVLLLILQNFQFTFSNQLANWYIPYTTYIIGLGLIFIVFGLAGKDNLTGLTIAGSIILVSGILLTYQDTNHNYQTWSYTWALIFPGAIGLALTLQSLTTQDYEQRRTGVLIMAIALMITLVGWSYFEGMVNLSGYNLHQLTTFVGPAVLMAIGVLLLVRRSTSKTEQEVS